MKKILYFINGGLFIFLLLNALFDPPSETSPSSANSYDIILSASLKNYTVSLAFFETSKNTAASWFGKSIDLEKSHFSIASVETWNRIRGREPRGYFEIGGQYESHLMNFASILPYFMGVLFLFSLFEYFSQRKK